MMHITLFGKFSCRFPHQDSEDCDLLKVKELFCFLLVNRDKPQARELIANALWGHHCTTTLSRKYLRNALWRLQAVLNKYDERTSRRLLKVESDWIQLVTSDEFSLDVARFESAYGTVKDTSGYYLDDRAAQHIDSALELYKGDLLESWRQDWCVFQRERLLQIYLGMLDKLMEHGEARGEYEKAISYGKRALQHDPGREHTHRQMMLLYSLAGNRSEALRQYKRCEAAMREELDATPANNTRALFEMIRLDQLHLPHTPNKIERTALAEALICLNALRNSMSEMQAIINRVSEAVKIALQDGRLHQGGILANITPEGGGLPDRPNPNRLQSASKKDAPTDSP